MVPVFTRTRFRRSVLALRPSPVAPAKARLNMVLSILWPKLTMVLVTVVPMFAPITMYIAGSIFTTVGFALEGRLIRLFRGGAVDVGKRLS